jgi:hypothetical protein
MKQWIKYSVPVAMGLIGLTASATQITGNVNMSGVVTTENAGGTAVVISQATQLAFSNPAGTVSIGATGAFAGTAGSLVNFANFTFAPLGSQTTPVNLWTYQSAASGQLLTYSFTLGNITSETHTDDQFLNLAGIGTISITGGTSSYTPQAADWTFTVTDSSEGTTGDFDLGFGQSDTTAIPDGGMTVMMLGAAFTGLSLVKRKLA